MTSWRVPQGRPTILPWARAPEQSALLPPEEVRALIRASGLEELEWQDKTAAYLEEQRAERERRGDAPPDQAPIFSTKTFWSSRAICSAAFRKNVQGW